MHIQGLQSVKNKIALNTHGLNKTANYSNAD